MNCGIARIVLMVVFGFVVPGVATAASVRVASPVLVAQAVQPPADPANTPTGNDTATPNSAPTKTPVLGVPAPARPLGSGNPLGTATPLGTPAPDATATTTTNGLPNDATNGVPSLVTPENTGINVNTNADGTLTQGANPPTTPNVPGTKSGTANQTGGLVAPFGATPKSSDNSVNSRNPLGTLGTTNRDVLGTGGSAYGTSGYFQQRGVETLPTIGRPLNGLSPTGINPQAAFYPSLPRTVIGVNPNSGYGVANGSRPTHMDSRGVQRVD